MAELVTRAQADAFFLGVLLLGLLLAPVAGWLARRRSGDPLLAALLWGGPLVLIGVLWRIYNAITDRVGLDSVMNLAVNAVLFVVVGAVCGLGWTWLTARRHRPAAAGTTGDPGSTRPPEEVEAP